MNKANETFKLLSKLLSEQNAPHTLYIELYEKVFSIIRQDVSKQLNKSTYPQKSKLISKLKTVLDSVEILTQFPEMIGKTIIGIMGTNGKTDDILLNKISIQKGLKVYKYDKNVPVIIYNNDDNENVINSVNLIESPISISPEEFINANKRLYKQKIDIRQFLFAFSVSTKLLYSNIVYINFPFYSLRGQEYYNNLLNFVDCIILPVDEKEKWKDTYDYLKKYKEYIDIHIVSDEKKINIAESIIKEKTTENNQDRNLKGENTYHKLSASIHLINDDFDEWLKSMNSVRNNVVISDRILSILSRFNIYQIQRIEYIKNVISGMNRDLLNIDDEETGSSIRKLKVDLNESLEETRKNFNDFTVVTDKLLKLVDEFENSLYLESVTSVDDLKNINVLYHGQFEENCSQLIINLIQTGNFSLARKYIDKLELRNYPYTYIFELYMDDKALRKLSSKDLEKLLKEDSMQNLVLKAKLKFGNLINLSTEDMGKYAQHISEPLDGYENYIMGEYYYNNNKKKAKDFYKKSLELGYLEAGKKLIKYKEFREQFELEKLANMLVPEANYLYGIKCLNNNKYARGITYLKIAAVLENVKAINKLADIEYGNACSKRNEKSINISMQLYQYLLQRDPNNIGVRENLGQIFYWKKEYRKARDLLEKCDSKYALFVCGRMYQYGNGVAQDIYKARDLFKLASDKGHVRASVEYEKVCGWIESNSIRNSYSKEIDYGTSSTYTHVSSSGGPCFLTTATCLALGKEDDCEELLAFKAYRDNHLIFDKDGAKLIREYYKIAPTILQEIEKEVSPNSIYEKLYDAYILVGYEYLKKNDLLNAKKIYIKMVKNLCDIYNIDITYKQ